MEFRIGEEWRRMDAELSTEGSATFFTFLLTPENFHSFRTGLLPIPADRKALNNRIERSLRIAEGVRKLQDQALSEELEEELAEEKLLYKHITVYHLNKKGLS